MNRILLILALLSLPALSQPTFTSLDARATGYGGGKSENYLAFERLLDQGPGARDQFEQLLKEGNGAGRLYAALGLWSLDPDRGRQAMTNLLQDREKVRLMVGCLGTEAEVREVANELLSDRPSMVGRDAFLKGSPAPAQK